eukprot:357075-Chlamydomonas_euryale.AAC.2
MESRANGSGRDGRERGNGMGAGTRSCLDAHSACMATLPPSDCAALPCRSFYCRRRRRHAAASQPRAFTKPTAAAAAARRSTPAPARSWQPAAAAAASAATSFPDPAIGGQPRRPDRRGAAATADGTTTRPAATVRPRTAGA